MFFVATVSTVLLYIFNADKVPLFLPGDETHLMDHDFFFAIPNFAGFLGDSLSRNLAYKIRGLKKRHRRYQIILCCMFLSVCGGVCAISKIGILAPLAMFLIFFGNGMLYASSNRFIDAEIASQFSLITLSVWLLFGDIGSVIASESVDTVRSVACDMFNPYPHHNLSYVCLDKN